MSRFLGLSSRLAAVSACAVLGFATPASAQSQAELKVAREHFKTARELEDSKNWEGASSELRAALAIKETPGLRYHLAYCQEQVGHFAAALRNYRRAQQLLTEGHQAADVSQLLGPAIKRVEAWVARLTLTSIDGGSRKIFLDGNMVDAGVMLIVDPGVHEIRSVTGEQEESLQISLKAGESKRIELGSEKPPAAATPPPMQPASDAPPEPVAEPRASQSSLKLPVLLGEGVITLAGLGLGIGFTLQANKASSEADKALADINQKDPERQCSSDSASVQSACAQLADFKQQEFDAKDLATVGFVAAGVGAASLITTWLLWPTSSASDGAVAGVSVWAHADRQYGAAGILGRF